MKCLLCENYSFSHICKQCQENLLQPSLHKRFLQDGTTVYSFYKYSEIAPLLFSKHTQLGFYIYNILAKLSFQKFAQEFHSREKYRSLAIDDQIKNGYSHTAILNNALKTYNIKPLHAALHARSRLTYSGKSKLFRETHPRDFQLKKFKQRDVILVDDIITTGTTLQEATSLLLQNNKEVAFCLTLCDVRLK